MKKILLLTTLILCGCSYQAMNAHPLPAKPPLETKIIFSKRIWPKCQYKEMGILMSSRKSSLTSALDEVREMGAEIGADYVKVDKTNSNYGLIFDSFIISATALSCDEKVNQERAPTKL